MNAKYCMLLLYPELFRTVIAMQIKSRLTFVMFGMFLRVSENHVIDDSTVFDI